MAPHTPLLPPPGDFDMPAKFAQWRHYQDTAILDAGEFDGRFLMQVIPTGAGKSLIYVMLAKLLGVRAVVLTRTKALQAQLYSDFQESGMANVRGMNSYLCRALQPGGELYSMYEEQVRGKSYVGCDAGPCRFGVSCSLKGGGCEYYDAVSKATTADLLVTNYTYWMNQNKHGRGLGQFGLLILDEAHDAPDALSDFLTVALEPWQLAKIGAKVLDGQPDAHQWAEWASFHHQKAQVQADKLNLMLTRMREERQKVRKVDVDEARTLAQLATTLRTIGGIDDSWVHYWSVERKAWVFAPAWPAPFAEQNLFFGIKKVVLTSATVRPKTAGYLGIAESELKVLEYASTFPAYRRPIYHIPTVKVTHKMTDADKQQWVARLDQLIGARLDRKGIVHTVSYARARFILQHSKYADKMISHSGDGTNLAIMRFKNAPPGTVLLSPSVTTGYDFPYEECEYQVITKIPFPDSRDPILEVRTHHDPDYGMYTAMQSLVQAAGRGMRAPDDQCEVFIIDDNAKWFVWKHRTLAPKWFLDTIRTRDLIPAPPPRLNRR